MKKRILTLALTVILVLNLRVLQMPPKIRRNLISLVQGFS